MTPPALAAVLAGGFMAVSVVVLVAALQQKPIPLHAQAFPRRDRLRRLRLTRPQRRRLMAWTVVGLGVWGLTGWPVAGVAVVVAGTGLPWLLGSTRVVRERLDTVEALETWCRRMSDMLAGGGAIGLAQAIVTTADRVDEPIRPAVRVLADRLRGDHGDHTSALREFSDAVDDRVGDAVAAALLLALHQQSVGVAEVLRQLADGVARDVRARRDIEASRAESRQSIRMLLVIQAALLGLFALVPSFAAPYGTSVGQVVMALLLAGTAALLVWMRRLSLGRRPPRFLGGQEGAP